MIAGRIIGWLLFLAAMVRLGFDLGGWFASGRWAPVALGQLWYSYDRSSLNLTQAVVQRYVAPFLWNPIIVDILRLWAFAVLLAFALAILFVFRKRPPQPRASEAPLSPPPF